MLNRRRPFLIDQKPVNLVILHLSDHWTGISDPPAASSECPLVRIQPVQCLKSPMKISAQTQ